MYKQGQYGAPPPILIPIRFDWSFLMTTEPDETVMPLSFVNCLLVFCLVCINWLHKRKLLFQN